MEKREGILEDLDAIPLDLVAMVSRRKGCDLSGLVGWWIGAGKGYSRRWPLTRGPDVACRF